MSAPYREHSLTRCSLLSLKDYVVSALPSLLFITARWCTDLPILLDYLLHQVFTSQISLISASSSPLSTSINFLQVHLRRSCAYVVIMHIQRTNKSLRTNGMSYSSLSFLPSFPLSPLYLSLSLSLLTLPFLNRTLRNYNAMSNDKRAATVKNVVEIEVSSNVCSFLEYMGYKYEH